MWCQVEVVRSKSMEAGAFAAVLSDHWAKGERDHRPTASTQVYIKIFRKVRMIMLSNHEAAQHTWSLTDALWLS